MPDPSSPLLDLLAQFTGGRGGVQYLLVNYAVACLFWGALFAVARDRYRDQRSGAERWLVWAFGFALGRDLFMIVVVALQSWQVLDPVALHRFFPPFEHTLRDISEIAVAAAFVRFVGDKPGTARRILYLGAGALLLCYVVTFQWWAAHGADLNVGFDSTWCDWLFRGVVSVLLLFAAIYLARTEKSELRNLVCAGLMLLFLYQSAKLVDMAFSGEFGNAITPVRRLCYLGGIFFLAFGYFRQVRRDRKAREESILATMLHQSLHDALTGLPNRVLLNDRLGQAILSAERRGHRIAVLFLDLDRFKNVNDTLGHTAGDELLRRVAQRLTTLVRASDTVCRQGGDEFVILLSEIDEARDGAQLASKIIESFREPYRVDGHELPMTTSVGIGIYPDDGCDMDALMKVADAAMYHAKDGGRNNYQFFTPEINRRALERVAMETNLRGAVQRGEFVLHYQPKMNLATGAAIGIEALIRWQRADGPLISPVEFIPAAEKSGLIVPIGEWALREACRQNRVWQKEGMQPMPVSVNVSAVQFRRKDFLDMVIRVLRETEHPADQLELELTESILMEDGEHTLSTLSALKDMGIRVSIDDFGTGYSSLSYLKSFPIDTLKIDQSFVRDIDVDAGQAAIVRAVISIAKILKQRIIAEGVETKAQLAFLMENDCDEMQGYLFSKPLTAAELSRFVHTNALKAKPAFTAPFVTGTAGHAATRQTAVE